MTKRVGKTLCLMATICITMAAQGEPALTALNLPHYPWLARQARVEGIVKVAFTLLPKSEAPTKVELISGPPISNGTAVEELKRLAVENVKTWRFQNGDAVEHRYETTFDFRLSGPKEVVSFQSFHYITVKSGGGEIIAN
jgi:hypothetical protein